MSVMLTGFLAFSLVAGFTPGPNNLMLATSGANFGPRRTLPHLIGVICGYPLLILGTGLGLGSIFTRFPLVHTALTVVGAVYLVWLAWKIAFAAAISNTESKARPIGFWQAVAFQWVNPKAWIMAATAVTVYVDVNANPLLQVPVLALIAGLVTSCSATTWMVFGIGIRRAVDTRPKLMRAFNIVMGLLLVASLLTLF